MHTICDVLDELRPRADARPSRAHQFVTDRPGHDFRYAIDPTKIEREVGWRAQVGFAEGIRRTIEWYLANTAWTDAIKSGAYRERLGLGRSDAVGNRPIRFANGVHAKPTIPEAITP